LRFELKVPSCVLTSFDLELPADRTATVVGNSCLLSGPQPGSTPDRRIWHLLCSGTLPIDLLIRRTSPSGDTQPLVLARLRTRQKLGADLLEADYDCNLEVLHGGIRELLCQGDAALHPTAVTVGNAEIETWEVSPGPAPGAPFNLRIRLRERSEGNLSLHIHCLATAAPKDRWTSPALRLNSGVFQGETLVLQLSPEVRLEDWRPGSYELTTAAPEADGGQTLTLQSGLREVPQQGKSEIRNPKSEQQGGGPVSDFGFRISDLRPSARIQIQEPEFRVHEVTWWRIGSDTASAIVQIDYEMVRGRLFRLPVLLPANWNLDRVELRPKELLSNWSPLSAERGQTYLIVELQRPLESPTTVRLTLQLRPATVWPIFLHENQAKPAPFSVSFPEILPQRARLSSAALAIKIDPLY